MKATTFDHFFIFFLVIFSLNFFSATFAQSGIVKTISFAYLLVAIFMSIPFFFRKSNGFIFPVKLISISIIFSIVMAYISWGQGLSNGVSTVPYSIWFVFFYLLHKKYPIEAIERIVLFFGVIYILLYFFQFFHSDVVYFGFREEFIEDRGIVRIDFPGSGVFFLSYFISLNKISERSKFRWLYVLFVITGILVTVLQVTRQSIVLVLVITLFHFMKKTSLPKKLATLLIFLSLIFYFLNSTNSIARGLAEKQKETTSESDKYIRVLASEYFLNDFSPNTISKIFGNGFPNNTSTYGKFTLDIGDTYGYYLTDLGLIGFYVMFGIFPIIGYIIIFFKSYNIKVPGKYCYLKYYMAFLVFTCLTSDYAYSVNYLFTNIAVLYCLQLIYEQKPLLT